MKKTLVERRNTMYSKDTIDVGVCKNDTDRVDTVSCYSDETNNNLLNALKTIGYAFAQKIIDNGGINVYITMSNNSYDNFVTPEEASKKIGVSVNRIRNDIKNNNLPFLHGTNSKLLNYTETLDYYKSCMEYERYEGV